MHVTTAPRADRGNTSTQSARADVAEWSPGPELMAAVANRNAAAFLQFYRHCFAPLLAVAKRIVGPGADAADVLQDSLREIWQGAGGYRAELGSPYAWASAIVRHKAIDAIRRRRREQQRNVDAGVAEEMASERAPPPGPEGLHLLELAAGKLSVEEMRALRLAYITGLTHAEIAVTLQAPVGTVKARLRRGLEKIRRTMKAGGAAWAVQASRAGASPVRSQRG